MNNEFVWTDEMVKEFIIKYNNTPGWVIGVDPILQTIKDFKKEKETSTHIFNWFEKPKEPTPLFITEDGVPIYQYVGYLWRVFTTNCSYEKWKPYKLEMSQCINFGEKYFSTEEAANEWIRMNKPILSLNDLLSVWANGTLGEGEGLEHLFYKNAPLYKNFEKLVNEKLKLNVKWRGTR